MSGAERQTAKKLPIVFIGLPVYGGEALADNTASIENVVRRMDSHQWGVYTYRVGMSDVVDARNCMLTYWYDKHPESDYILMIDNDMVFDWQMVIKMFMIDKPVVGCIYSKKHIAAPGEDGKLNFWDISVGEPLADQKDYPVIDGFQQWKYVGAGILLIKREVITELLEKYPEMNDFTDPGFMVKSGVSRVIGAFDKIVDPDGRHLSEDLSFCWRWRQCGGEIWAAVGWTIGHRGLFTYNFNAEQMLGLGGKPAEIPQSKRYEYIPGIEYDMQDETEISWLADNLDNADSLLEIGSCGGQSMRYLSKGLKPGAKIRSIDIGMCPTGREGEINVETKDALLRTVEELRGKGFDVEVFFGDSHSKEAKKWAFSQGGYDAVFIDGDHTFQGVKQDYEDYAPMGKRLVALHDIANKGAPGVVGFWKEHIEKSTIGKHAKSMLADGSSMGIGIIKKAKVDA